MVHSNLAVFVDNHGTTGHFRLGQELMLVLKIRNHCESDQDRDYRDPATVARMRW